MTPERTVFMVMGELRVQRGGLTRVMLDRANLFVNEGYKVKIVLLTFTRDLEQVVAELKRLGRVDERIKFINVHRFFILNESNLSKNNIKIVYDKEEELFEVGLKINLDKYESELTADYFKGNQFVKTKKWKKNEESKIVLDWILNPVLDEADKYSIDMPYAQNTLLQRTVLSHKNNCQVEEIFFGPDGTARIAKYAFQEYEALLFKGDGEHLKFKHNLACDAFLLEYVCKKEAQKPIVIIDGAYWADLAILLSENVADIIVVGHTSHLLSPYKSDSEVIPYFGRMFKNWRRFAGLIVLTEKQKRDILDRYPNVGNLCVIPNCIPDARIPPALDFSEKDCCRAVCVTRLVEEKNLEAMLHAFAIVVRKNKTATLDIYGTGEEDKLVRLAQALGLTNNVFFKGYVTDVNEVYRSALISILPSKTEGLPLALLESMLNEVPVVAFACNYGPEEIITDGGDGILVDQGNIRAMADSILYLFEDINMAHNMGKAARVKIMQKFSEKKHIQKWRNLFQGIAPCSLVQDNDPRALSLKLEEHGCSEYILQKRI